ncbi:hypothetical protein F3J23_16150 [Chryseobacterium sp. Tr-659]|uniref:hypothetical protein n=1 Tax=Chryseobacterium sp. Tr-659 TaxID=2608340 RepID=UPI00141F2624|nr:hypothetical protein [Chryseobacterium sp. Tr-659]NIF06972.1 hypothetical protein [Chryseobacterium sp. Tr-659]
MRDILEFKIVIHEGLSNDSVIDSFIAFIEDCSVYWGGSYSCNQLNGGLYADENMIVNINDFIKNFIVFFINLKIGISKIEINIEDFYFSSFDHDTLVKTYPSLPISIGYWEIQ